MLLSKLLDECVDEIEITSLAIRAENCSRGSLFFCIKGERDGRDYVETAVKNGAVAIISFDRIDNCTVKVFVVSDVRATLGKVSAAFYSHPEKQLKFIGITGTNGKTTTSFMTASILSCAGVKTGIIGTLGAFVDGACIERGVMTTPDPPEFYKTLREMADMGVECVVMEVSAHALALEKVSTIRFDVAALTNIGCDHLDYFRAKENYAQAKRKLFEAKMSKARVINADDREGRVLISMYPDSISYGLDNPSDVFAVNENCSLGGIRFVMNVCDDIIKICCPLPGKFNVYNALCAAGIARAMGVDNASIADGLKKLTKVDGRFNVISGARCKIVIDFAHTEESLEKAIDSVRECAHGKVVVVFGCGGNRDREKRPKMGKIASKKADFCVITSDNPRYESAESIINDITSGIERNNYVAVPDRKQAIRCALECAGDNGIVLIAGKGGENYQEINGVKYEYSDEKYIKTLIEENVIK